jgi:nucleotide-binding universal stress UspA family protein
VAVAPTGFGRAADGGLGWRPLSGDTKDAGMRVIGVGYDGSPAAHRALDVAVELAIPNGAALRVYAVAARIAHGALESQAPGVPARAEELREQLHDAVAELPPEVRALPEFIWGSPAAELVAAAGIGVDLMVLGARGGGPVSRALGSSVSSAVLAQSSCPVLITPLHVEAPAALAH